MSQQGKKGIEVNRERLWGHLRVLCEEIGPRLSGTPADERAVEYIADHMRKCGAEVEVQDYPCPGWEHESTELALLGADGPKALPAFAQTFTEACDVEAELVGVGSPDELEFAPDLEGKVLVLHGKIASSLTPDRNRLLLIAEERRAAALIVVNPEEPVPSKLVRDPFVRVPAAAVAQSVGRKLLASEGERLRLRIRARRYDSTSHNVIGRFPGEQEGHIAVAAHYDSAADSPGASDNASGTAVVLELCELFADAGQPRPGIHFIAYGAEEYGRRGGACLGAVEYVRRHAAETSQMLALIEPDCVGTAAVPPRVTVMGFEPSQREGVVGVLERFPRYEVRLRPETETPHTPFDLTGVPAVWFVNNYTRLPIHAAEDAIDVLNPDEMAFTAEVAAAV
ncbi:MAG: M28 family peptidase, partial [Candidatus Brocadiae bacterium]|nr:M28 family peptidase [Candidatus Brocadiia bacterium]